jgi:hypothetical protein
MQTPVSPWLAPVQRAGPKARKVQLPPEAKPRSHTGESTYAANTRPSQPGKNGRNRYNQPEA